MGGGIKMDDYDKKAWDALQRERERQLSRSPRRLVPGAVRKQARELGRTVYNGASAVPGFNQAEDLVEQILGAAGDVGARVAAESLVTGRITSAYRKAGHDSVELITDIRDLRLRHVDKVKPNFGLGYIATGVGSGAAAGFAVSGGEFVALVGGLAGGAAGGAAGGGVGAVPGAGAGAAPGAGLIVGAIAADTAAVLLATVRAVFHTAAYYGYDINRPEERLRALSVLNYATATGQAAKNQAYLEAEKLAGLIVRNATWNQLDQNVLTKIIRRVFELLGVRLTKKGLGVALPVLGAAAGAFLNARTLSGATDGAEFLYRQQYLCDQYDLPFPDGTTRAAAPNNGEAFDIPLTDIIEEELTDAEPPADDEPREAD